MTASGAITTPFGWGIINPPAILLLMGMSAPVMIDQKRWRSMAMRLTIGAKGPLAR